MHASHPFAQAACSALRRLGSLPVWSLPLWSVLMLSCATTPPPSAPAVPTRTHYTLRRGAPEVFSPPLPTRTTVYVQWHYSDGHVEEQAGFQAWDFLGQGLFSMVQVLDDEGQPAAYLYDFDGDGRLDPIAAELVGTTAVPVVDAAPAATTEVDVD